jgi:hypothetical protein
MDLPIRQSPPSKWDTRLSRTNIASPANMSYLAPMLDKRKDIEVKLTAQVACAG